LKIESIRIENFRGFEDETIDLGSYSCLVGPNGAGKSTVLAALNVFFLEQASSPTDTGRLIDEDYFRKNVDDPVRVTVTFNDFNRETRDDLSDYVRQDALVVTAEAVFNATAGSGQVRHYGQRQGMEDFRRFFDARKASAKALELKGIYDKIQEEFVDLPNAGSTDARAAELHAYESAHPELCQLIKSEDDFYGVGGKGKLAKRVQWVFVPAVKDAREEGQESKNSAFEKLISRAVDARGDFDTEFETLKDETREKYCRLLEDSKSSLDGVSAALQRRLKEWAHPDVRLDMDWLYDAGKAVTVMQPVVGVKTGEGGFQGGLSRMGHGLQRSYLLALLQEIADCEAHSAPTLLLGCEEPELYQHPPQARHLADVLRQLASGNAQVVVTTHSPLFVSGEGFEDVRLVSRTDSTASATVRALTHEELCERIRGAKNEDTERRTEGLVAKIHQALQPGIAEMFFSRVPVLVEGLEDVSYITTALHLSGQWSDFRRLGCHLIPANGKDKLVNPLAMARGLGIMVFVVFDADGDELGETRRPKHRKDNQALMALLEVSSDPFPVDTIWGHDHAIWSTKLGDQVKADFGAHHARLLEDARLRYAQEGGLEKNDLFIADWLSAAHDEGLESPTLKRLCGAILDYAQDVD
jgi:putative ATP-dependent endonuclease of the OLD family